MKKVMIFTSFFVLLLSSMMFAGVRTAGRPVRLTGGDAGYQYMRPIWSPDGSKIAFTSVRYNGIWVISADGTDERQVTNDVSAGYGFQWSADSKIILARAAKYDKYRRYNAVKTYDVESGADALISEFRTSALSLPQWGDDDTKIYTVYRNRMEIYDSGKARSALKRSNTNRQVYFIKEDRVARGDLVTRDFKLVQSLREQRYINLVLSPDKLKLAFEEVGGNLFVMNIDGSGLTDLGNGHRPQWSPDSQYLTYMITEDDGYRFTAADIYFIKIDGTEKSRLEFREDRLEMNPCWSADRIVYDVLDEGAIYIVEIDQ